MWKYDEREGLILADGSNEPLSVASDKGRRKLDILVLKGL